MLQKLPQKHEDIKQMLVEYLINNHYFLLPQLAKAPPKKKQQEDSKQLFVEYLMNNYRFLVPSLEIPSPTAKQPKKQRKKERKSTPFSSLKENEKRKRKNE